MIKLAKEDNGWFKLHRDIYEKAIWQTSTPEQKTILITLLGMANHKEKEWEWNGEVFKADKGQFITSLDSIVQKCGKGISVQNVRTALKRFERYEFLTNKSTKTGRLITIVNWELYQAKDEVLTKESTDDQQTGNKDLTPNKNDKNDKKNNYIRKIENFRQRYSSDELTTIDEYMDILKTTRVSGKISDSVMCQVYEHMSKHAVVVVIYACRTVISKPNLHSKKENYFYGIMKNTKADDAVNRLNQIYKPNQNQENDIERQIREIDERSAY
mgnify:CR=1 FL=1